MENKDIILKVEHLKTEIGVGKKTVHAVNDANLVLERGKTLGIVGESGCGKSITAFSVMQLIPKTAKIAGGTVTYFPENREPQVLTDYKTNSKEMRAIRGKDIAMVFQDPMASLNPVYTIGDQIMENLKNHEKLPKEEAKARIIKLLGELGIPAPEQRYNEYPHQFSGGMKQRVMIAIAMICNPSILIADEPTTALDVTIQSQILALMKQVQQTHGTSIALITHNMGIVANFCDNVVVMYMGRDVESGTVEQIFNNPQHPYTKALLNSVPVLGMDREQELSTIEGSTPDPTKAYHYCEFAPRCPYASERCRTSHPDRVEIEPGHLVRCYLCKEDA